MSEPPPGVTNPPLGPDWSGRAAGLLVLAGFAIVLAGYALPFMDGSGSTLSGFQLLLLIPWAWAGAPLMALQFFGIESLALLLAVVGLLSQLDRGRRGLLVGCACSALGSVGLVVFFGFVAWTPYDIHLDFGFYVAAGGFLISAASSLARLGGARSGRRSESRASA